MPEVVVTPVSEAAATTIGEASLAEAGGGPGAAGRQRSPKLSATILRYQKQQALFSLTVLLIILFVVVVHFFVILV